jgi:site-specific recombinase XerD
MKTLTDLLEAFLAHGRALNHSGRTLKEYKSCVRCFLQWLEDHYDIRSADRLGPDHLEQWLHHLGVRRRPTGLPLKIKTVRVRIATLRSFLKYLAKHAYVQNDLPDALVAPKDEERLPTSVLSHEQMDRLLTSVDVSSPLGQRDRTILEILYTSGIRAAELLGLDIGDVDIRNATARVMGKGRKERVVPIGKCALRLLESYLAGIRPFLIGDPEEEALFISRQGGRLTYTGLRRMVHIYADPLGFDVSVSPHTFRRSCATELIRSGANPYHVKELLGHESLDMLKPYTRLTIEDLKRTHELTHPREQDEE